MLTLGIETSCDETSAAVVEDGRRVLSNVVASQIELHRKTGGVVPEVAAREHVVKMIPVLDQALNEARCGLDVIDGIAVAHRPGLIASLLVGTNTANVLAAVSGKPLIPVNHIEGHIYSNWLDRAEVFEFPIVVLTVSGGHSELVLMRDHGDFVALGSTRDDAAGEAFDKVARLLDLSYPGGPEISKLAKEGDASRYVLPRAWLEGSYDFSFSGLKSAVARLVEAEGPHLQKAHLAAAFQDAVIDVLSRKLVDAAMEYGAREVHLAGGVSANHSLRETVEQRLKAALPGTPLRFPQKLSYCTDNAAMIASAGTFRFQKNPSLYTQNQLVEASTVFGF